ncbi:MAG: efflux RND transporter periplasmic adaptor subunit [Bacteroidetes bacterium]|nr:efflux RND transporter periplasmic adaptor subunit [Bacteroidota bacterium]
MKNKLRLPFMLLVTAGILASCGKNEVEVGKEARLKVAVKEVSLITQSSKRQFSGKVVADDKLILSTKLQGQVKQLLVDEGDKVRKGQLLLTIKSNELDARLASTGSSLKEAQSSLQNIIKNYSRISKLFEKGSATQKEMDDITAGRDAATARTQSVEGAILELEELLTYASLTSPINGFVSQKFINPGAMATPGSPLIAIESLEELKVDINVPEFEIGTFTEGDPVEVHIGTESFSGQVNKIIPSSEFSGPQFKVSVKLLTTNEGLKPGMFARVSLLKETESKILVPITSIYQRGQLTGIFTVSTQGEALLRWVRTGKEFAEGVEILSGLVAGEKYIVASESKLYDGIKVEISNNI